MVSGRCVADINITKTLLEAGKKAHNGHKRRLEEEKFQEQIVKKARLESLAEKEKLEESRKEMENRKQSMKEKEKALFDLDKQHGQELRSAEKVFSEDNERLKKQLRKTTLMKLGLHKASLMWPVIK
jgi:hypothetical protein